MRALGLWAMVMVVAALHLGGCAAVRTEDLPRHEEVLVYELPYDLTYLRTIEAVENVQGWELEETEKEKGIIRVRNVNYSSFADADKRQATILVRRVGRRETSVALAPYSQYVIDGDTLLERISQYVSTEL